MHEINLFLASPTHPKNLMFHNLRTELKKLPGSEQVLVHLLNVCVDSLNDQKFVLPEEKYGFIRVLPHLLWLIDGDYSMKRGVGDTPRDASASAGQTEPINVFKHRAIRLNAVQEVFKRYPVVPEFGDLVMTMAFLLDKCPHYDDASMSRPFGRQPDDKIKGLYNVRTHWRRIRNQYGDYLASFSSLSSRINAKPFAKDRTHIESPQRVFDTVLQGLKLLEQWTSCVLEMIAWKFTHPCSTEDKAGFSKDTPGKEYETVGRYNYSKEELSALIDVMSMTKSLAEVMIKYEPMLAPFLRFYMHERLQRLAQEDLVPVLHRIHKNRRSMLNLLLEARRVVADWKEGKEPVDDYKR